MRQYSNSVQISVYSALLCETQYSCLIKKFQIAISHTVSLKSPFTPDNYLNLIHFHICTGALFWVGKKTVLTLFIVIIWETCSHHHFHRCSCLDVLNFRYAILLFNFSQPFTGQLMYRLYCTQLWNRCARIIVDNATITFWTLYTCKITCPNVITRHANLFNKNR